MGLMVHGEWHDDDARAAPLAFWVDHALLAHFGDADLTLTEFGCHS